MVTNLVYILADVLSTLALISIARSGWSTSSRLHESKRKEMAWPAWGVAAAYVPSIFRGKDPEKERKRALVEQCWLTFHLLPTR